MFSALFFTAVFVFFKVSGVKIEPSHLCLLLFLGILGFRYLLYSSSMMNFFTTLFLVWASLYLIFCIGAQCKVFSDAGMLKNVFSSVFVAPFTHFGHLFRGIGSLFSKGEKAKKGIGIIVGLVIALPLSAMLIILLSKADALFEEISSKVFSDFGQNLPFHLFQIGLGVLCAMFLFGALCAAVRTRKKQEKENAAHSVGVLSSDGIPLEIVCALLTPVCLVYIVFFITQSSYFLSAFSGTLPPDMGFAEFARRGFFELCGVAAINAGLLVLLTAFTKANTPASKRVKNVYKVVFTIFTILLTFSAMSKLYLYIRVYGLTLTRVYAAWFLLLLAVCFLLVLANCFLPRLRVLQSIGMTFLVFFAALCLLSPDYLVASYNVNAYEKGLIEEMDVSAFYELSFDAVAPAAKLLDAEDQNVANQARNYLIHAGKAYFYADKGALSWTASDAKAKKVLEENGLMREAENLAATQKAKESYDGIYEYPHDGNLENAAGDGLSDWYSGDEGYNDGS